MALIDGTKVKKTTFFEATKTALKRGYNFLTGDRPSEQRFRDFMESIPFFANYEDRAKEEDGSSTIENLQGLTIAARDSQVLDRSQEKSDVKTWSVQPSQVTEVSGEESTTIGSDDTSSEEDGNSPFDGEVISTARDTSTTTHNKYVVQFATGFATWLGSLYNQVQSFLPRLIPSGGTAGQMLVSTGNDDDVRSEWQDSCCVVKHKIEATESIPLTASMIAWMDTTSFSDSNYDTAVERSVQYYAGIVADNPAFTGKLYIINRRDEHWLDWPRQWNDPTNSKTTVGYYEPDGSGGITQLSDITFTTPPSIETVQLSFIDESYDNAGGGTNSSFYTGDTIADLTNPVYPNNIFKSHYDLFTVGSQGYDAYDYFAGVVYMANGGGGGAQLANLQANVVQSIEEEFMRDTPSLWTNTINGNGPWSLADAGWAGTSLDFMSDGSQGELYSGYNGLSKFGFSYVMDIPTGQMSSVSELDFKGQVDSALFDAADTKIINLSSSITLANGEIFTSSTSFEVAN